MKGITVFKLLLFIIIIVFVSSIGFWYWQKPKVASIYILDKTVLDEGRLEHKSFNWVLNYSRYINKNHKPYQYDKDYYGFFPDKNSKENHQYKEKFLHLFEVLSIADDLDMVYYADTYGVTYQDWFHKAPDKYHSSLLYGGLNQNDYLLLSEMKRKNKLIVTEFNLIGSPTSDFMRVKTEELFDFQWTGWTGCFFNSLDPGNINMPDWAMQRYEVQYKKKWNFTGPGIILVNENGEIVILSASLSLTEKYPEIITGKYGQEKYHLPYSQYCSFWFDIISPGSANQVVSKFKLNVNNQGKALLDSAKIPIEFPAIIEHLDHYKFYYFSGNFAERELCMGTSYLKGYSNMAKIFHWKSSVFQQSFFWNFYLPLMNSILENNLSVNKESVLN